MSQKVNTLGKALIGAVISGVLMLASPAMAEIELSFYGGTQSSPHSRVTGVYPTGSGGGLDGTSYSNLIGWDGKSFAPPPYYGMRAMFWRPNNIGWGVEFSHTKVYAPTAEMPIGFSRLEFTDGHNIFTANVMKRWPDKWRSLTPYAGVGVGFALPHVDVTVGGSRTLGYQLTGPAAKVIAGVKYDINSRWAVFTEYQFTWSDNKATLSGGGTLNTRIISNAVNFGLAVKF